MKLASDSSSHPSKAMSLPSLLLFLLFSCFCLGVGSILLKITLSTLLEARDSRAWPSALGVMDESRVQLGTGPRSKGYSQVVHYHFMAGSRRYDGSRLDYKRRTRS